MAYVRCYDFEQMMMPVGDAYYYNASLTTEASRVYTGDQSLNVIGNIQFQDLNGESTFGISMWLYNYNDDWTVSGGIQIRFVLTDGYEIELKWDATNTTFDLYVNGDKVADGSYSLPSNNYFNLRCWGSISNSGTFNVKLEGIGSISYSGDLVNTSASIDYIEIKSNTVASGQTFVDNLAFFNNAADPGDIRCNSEMRPSADTAVADWDPSTGSDHYAVVDGDDDDYVESQNSAESDEYDLIDFTGTDKTIVAASEWNVSRKTTAGAQQLKHGVDSDGTDDTTTDDLTTSYEVYFHDMDDNPDDDAEWEDADLDALKLRLEYA